MDDRLKVLYYMLLMRPFRSVYSESIPDPAERFRVQVIGYRQRMSLPVEVPAGVAWWFLFMFYDRIPAMTSTGHRIIQPGAMIICPPGSHLAHGEAGTTWMRSWIRCAGTEVGGAIAEAGLPTMRPLVFDGHDENERHLLGIHEELTHPRGADPQSVLDLFRIWMRGARRALRDAGPRVPAEFIVARRYVESRYRERFSLDELAASCALSKSYLCKGFRRHFGTSPVALAIRVRLEHARELLRNVDLNVTEVARECGFADVFYFSRVFKKHTGLSPRAFRRHAGGEPSNGNDHH